MSTNNTHNHTPNTLIDTLLEGNQRFINNTPNPTSASLVDHSPESQSPHTIVLACADSRVAPELIFDQPLGQLFVVRVAGNIVTPESLGSIEYAVHALNTRLIIVLAHSNCGAVSAAHTTLSNPDATAPLNQTSIPSIINTITPAITKDQPLQSAIESNAHHASHQLTSQSPLIKSLVDTNELTIAPMCYHLDTKRVQPLPAST